MREVQATLIAILILTQQAFADERKESAQSAILAFVQQTLEEKVSSSNLYLNFWEGFSKIEGVEAPLNLREREIRRAVAIALTAGQKEAGYTEFNQRMLGRTIFLHTNRWKYRGNRLLRDEVKDVSDERLESAISKTKIARERFVSALARTKVAKSNYYADMLTGLDEEIEYLTIQAEIRRMPTDFCESRMVELSAKLLSQSYEKNRFNGCEYVGANAIFWSKLERQERIIFSFEIIRMPENPNTWWLVNFSNKDGSILE